MPNLTESMDRILDYEKVKEAMELQRQRFGWKKLTPVLYFHNDFYMEGWHDVFLYVPDWLKVSSAIKSQARPLEQFPEKRKI